MALVCCFLYSRKLTRHYSYQLLMSLTAGGHASMSVAPSPTITRLQTIQCDQLEYVFYVLDMLTDF